MKSPETVKETVVVQASSRLYEFHKGYWPQVVTKMPELCFRQLQSQKNTKAKIVL